MSATQPPNHFERLGLPERFDLDLAVLDQAFLTSSRAVHPDHHAGGQDDTAAVNAAYHTLRDPLRRAEYLLGPGVAPPADPAFLMEMMDLRERAESGDPTVAAELETRFVDLTASLGRQLDADDVPAAQRTLAAAKTVRSLLRQVAGD